jgi:calcineurin-like phosphoesterase family protein
MQEIYFTSDQHFYHKRIIQHTNRPFKSTDEMHEALIDAWNSKVRKKGDLVYHLGDFIWKPQFAGEILKKLNGQIILICGNHDSVNARMRKNFLTVVPYREIRIAGRKIVLFHYPIESWNGRMHGFLHFHGHEHGAFGRPVTRQNRLDVGVDTNPDYTPYHIDELLEHCEAN